MCSIGSLFPFSRRLVVKLLIVTHLFVAYLKRGPPYFVWDDTPQPIGRPNATTPHVLSEWPLVTFSHRHSWYKKFTIQEHTYHDLFDSLTFTSVCSLVLPRMDSPVIGGDTSWAMQHTSHY